MKMFILPIMVFLLSAFCLGQELTLIGQSIVDPKALNLAKGKHTKFSTRINAATHQQEALSTFKGYQYVTYYDAQRHVCLGRRQLPDGPWQIIRFTDYRFKSSDSHRVTSLGICQGDGTIHLAFDHHGGSLHYRVSNIGVALNPDDLTWDRSLFGPVTDRLGPNGKQKGISYPRFIPSPKGDLLFYFRRGGSGSGDGHLFRYQGAKSQWVKAPSLFISQKGTYRGVVTPESKRRNPYLNTLSYGGTRLHASWCWRETPNAATNHSLAYTYSDDHGKTWRNNQGKKIGETGTSPITISAPGLTVVEIPQGQGLTNQNTHYAYPDHSVHVITRYRPPTKKERLYHHHFRSPQGKWTTTSMNFRGSRPKLVGGPDRSLYLVAKEDDALEVTRGTPQSTSGPWTWKRIYRQKGTQAGGDGLIDLSCWNLYGVLSILDQEKPSHVLRYRGEKITDGLPTPLIVRDFRPTSAKN